MNMKTKNKLFPVFIIAIFILALLTIKSYFEWQEKQVEESKPLSFVFVTLSTIVAMLMEGRVKALLSKVPFLGRWLGGGDEKELILTAPEIDSLKKKVLALTQSQISKRLSLIEGPEMIGGKFAIDCEFNAGIAAPNDEDNWKKLIDRQFAIITGEKGTGKSFEMINRVEYFHKELTALYKDNSNPEVLNRVKIPLYIELTSINKNLSTDWMADYASKTAEIAEIELKREHVKWLIEKNQVVFFFDGIDEMLPPYRNGSVTELVELSKNTGVTATCRGDVYLLLRREGIIGKKFRPAEWATKLLSLEKMTAVIGKIKPSEKTKYTLQRKKELTEFINRQGKHLHNLSKPIYFNLFILIFPHLSDDDKKKLEHADEAVFNNIVYTVYEDAIARKKLHPDEDILCMRTYTVWLARIMEQQSFFVESIQPDWLRILDKNNKVLPSRLLQRCFYVVTRVIAAMVIGCAMGCIYATPFALLSDSIVGGLTLSLIAGIYNLPSRTAISDNTTDKIFQTGLIIVLILVCGVYQGLSVPRQGSTYFSIAETWPGILFGIILSTIFSYRIVLEKSRRQYILPIEVFHFDWPHAFRYGVSWGFISATIVGFVAVAVNITKRNVPFMKNWLIPEVTRIGKGFNMAHLSDMQVNYGIFAYGFFAMFMVATLIIIAMAGRFSEEKADAEKKQKLNYAIRQSFRHAIFNAFKVGVVCGLFYVAFALKFENIDIVHCVTFPVGMFLLAFLWFGGMEGVNHILLRSNLYLRGIAPKNYYPWVQAHEDMGLIIPTGYQMRFSDDTVADYYKNYPLDEKYDVPRLSIKRNNADLKAYAIIFLLFAILIAFPFYFRYVTKGYWKSPREIRAAYNPADVAYIPGDTVYRLKRQGSMTISASGFINVGTFVGWVWPTGTTYGFMGMPLGDSYNILNGYNHSALLFRISADRRTWGPYTSVAATSPKCIINIPVTKGEFIQFLVNDREWQNNKAHYRVKMYITEAHPKPNDKKE